MIRVYDEGVWERLQGAVKTEGRDISKIVTNALRLYFTTGPMKTSPGDPSGSAEAGVVTPSGSVAEKRARAEAALLGTGTVTTAAEMLRRREAEQRRIAHNNHLRTHPEEESQDPEMGF